MSFFVSGLHIVLLNFPYPKEITVILKFEFVQENAKYNIVYALILCYPFLHTDQKKCHVETTMLYNCYVLVA